MTKTISTAAPKKARGGIGAVLRDGWEMCSKLPFGNLLFSTRINLKAPYTGTIGAKVLELAPGYAKVSMKDRWFVRNFVPSIHAVAMTNLGEMTSGIAFLHSLPPGLRGIVAKLSTEYHKVAHGTLVAISYAPSVEFSLEKRTFEVRAYIYQLCSADTEGAVVIPCAPHAPEGNETGVLVATFIAEWHVSPITEKSKV